ncbi:MAG: hypothetical protein HY322_09915 [Betaproteobacteria bacterium]|nr:hypothetical protein [Betaproteobacteria bacterium]
MTLTVATPHLIELRIRELTQLFNSMDPTPFHHKDLDPDAEEFIVSWALEHPRNGEFQIAIHLVQPPAADEVGLAREAIHNYFAYRAEHAQRELRQMLQRGRVSLAIGLVFLAACLLIADFIAQHGRGTFYTVVRESFTIGGWVAMWRPMEIFLYDWWPLRHRRRIYEKLSRAEVRLQYARA